MDFPKDLLGERITFLPAPSEGGDATLGAMVVLFEGGAALEVAVKLDMSSTFAVIGGNFVRLGPLWAKHCLFSSSSERFEASTTLLVCT